MNKNSVKTTSMLYELFSRNFSNLAVKLAISFHDFFFSFLVSGLANFVPIEEMKDRMVVVLCNLKPAKLKGVESKGMVLCASRDDPKEVEPLSVPEGCQPGDKCLVEGYETGTPDEQLNPKKKIWDKLAEDFKTSNDCIAQWQSNNLMTPKGPVFCKTVKGAPVK